MNKLLILSILVCFLIGCVDNKPKIVNQEHCTLIGTSVICCAYVHYTSAGVNLENCNNNIASVEGAVNVWTMNK